MKKNGTKNIRIRNQNQERDPKNGRMIRLRSTNLFR